MSERLSTQRISIPPRNVVDAAIAIGIQATIEAGLDPMKAGKNPMFAAILHEWRDGRWTREQFIHACGNLAILNPSLKGGK